MDCELQGTYVTSKCAFCFILVAALCPLLAAQTPSATTVAPAAPPAEKPDPAAVDAATKEFTAAYTLKDTENFRLILPPFLPGRLYYYAKVRGISLTPTTRSPRAMYFKCSPDFLELASAAIGDNTLWKLITMPLGLGLLDLDGDARLLNRALLADVVWRQDAPRDALLAEMQAAFAKQFVTPLALAFRESEREVYVARGSFVYKPESIESGGVYYEGIQIDPTPPASEDQESDLAVGTAENLLARVSGCIGFPIVSEITGADAGIMWIESPRLLNLTDGGSKPLSEPDLSAVLAHVAKQTGLSFSKEKRKIRRLTVAIADSERSE
jgi:hypothetical protein